MRALEEEFARAEKAQDVGKDMVPAIKENGVVVDKFIGDAIMAVWGVPEPVEDAPYKAVKAALAMRNATRGYAA